MITHALPRAFCGFRMTRSGTLVLFVLSAALAEAAITDVIWSGANNSTFSTAGNWDGGSVPTTSNRAVINAGGPTVIYDASSLQIGGLSIASGFTLTRDAADTTNRTLTLWPSSTSDTYFENAGTISSGGTSGTLTVSVVAASGTTFTNAGIIEATAGTTLELLRSASAPLLDNTGGTLRTVGTGKLVFYHSSANAGWDITGGNLANNSGTIDFLSRKPFNLTDVTFTNGGTANFDEPAISNSGGYGISLKGTSTLNNSGIINLSRNPDQNTNTGASNAVISSASASTSITNSGTINITTAGDSATSGSGYGGISYSGNDDQILNNTGTINLESKSTTHDVAFSNTITSTKSLTIQGAGGEIVMKVGTGGSVDRVLFTGSNTTVIQSAGHTIRGAGQLGNGLIYSFTNNGTVLADDATYALTIDPRNNGKLDTGVGRFYNNGTLQATGAGGLVLNDGIIINDGAFIINAGSSLTQNAAVNLTNNAGKTLDIQGTWNSGTGGGGLVANSGNISYNSAENSSNTIGLTGSGALTKSGSGTLSLNGANSLTGNTVINGGTLAVVTGAGSTFTADTTNGNYKVTTTDTTGLVVGQSITGTGVNSGVYITGILSSTEFAMSKNASSSQAGTSITSAGFSSLGTGAVTINGGTLQLGSGTHTVSSVSLGAGAISGIGTLNGLVTTTGTSSTISPGISSVDTLSFATGLDATAGVTFNLGLGTSSDLVDIGALTGSSATGGMIFNITREAGITTGIAYTLLTFDSQTGVDYSDLTLSSGNLSGGFELDAGFGTGGFLINAQDIQVQFSSVTAAIPEPASFGTLAAAAVALAAMTRRRRRTS